MNRLILAAVFLAGQSALGQEFASNGDPVLAGYIERALEANPGVGQAFAQ